MESMVDSNNNAASGKYSLRPRSGVKRPQEIPEEEDVFKTCRRVKKSSPRGISLSKYRRKSANARERCRMREINAAFEALRRVVGWPSDSQGEKATKISTLRLAMSHITALSEALQESNTSGESHRSTISDEMFDDSDLSVGEFVMQEHSTEMSPDFRSLTNQPQLSAISSPIRTPQPEDFRNISSGFQDVSSLYSDSSAMNGSSSLDYNLPTRCTSIMPHVTHVNPRAGAQCDNYCDNRLSNSKPDAKVQVPGSGPLTSPSFHPVRQSTPGQPSSFQHTPVLDDCSSLLSTDIDTHPLHPISFEEIFIT